MTPKSEKPITRKILNEVRRRIRTLERIRHNKTLKYEDSIEALTEYRRAKIYKNKSGLIVI